MIDDIRQRYPRVGGQQRTQTEKDIHYLLDYGEEFKQLSDRLRTERDEALRQVDRLASRSF